MGYCGKLIHSLPPVSKYEGQYVESGYFDHATAGQSLIYRGDAGTGWSVAWKMNLWVRLLDYEMDIWEKTHVMLKRKFLPILRGKSMPFESKG